MIFISYSHRDSRELALRLYADLTKDQYEVWLDLDRLQGGGSPLEEIERAIDRSHVMLALLSDHSFRSPICRSEHGRALRKGRRVIPLRVQIDVDSPLYFEELLYRDFHDAQHYARDYKRLREDIDSTSDPVHRRPSPTPVSAPELPPGFIERPDLTRTLRNAVLADAHEDPVVLIPVGGAAGVGKSLLALRLAHDETVHAAFPDGVIWLQIGPEPVNLAEKMREAGRALGDRDVIAYETEPSAATRLRSRLADRAVLFVLDDVWNMRQLEPFLVRGPRTRTFFTTRNLTIAFTLGTNAIHIGGFTREQSLTILRQAAGDHRKLNEIAARLGDLPQAIRIAGAQLRAGTLPDVWLDKFTGLRDLAIWARQADARLDLEACLQVTVNQLEESEQNRFFSLGIFPPSTRIPIRAVSRLWKQTAKKSDTRTRLVIDKLANYSLLHLNRNESVELHSLVRDYVRDQLGADLSRAHANFIESYRSRDQPWPSLPDDGYLHSHLAYHLHDAGRHDELRALLLDFEWYGVRLKGSGISDLLSDFEFMTDDAEVRLMQSAIRLSESAIAADREQLGPQLIGRLSPASGPRIAALLERAARVDGIWLRPVVPTLNAPDGALQRTLRGHADGVAAVAISPDGRTLISGSDDGTTRIWELPSGAERSTIVGNGAGIKAVALSSTRGSCGSDDGTVKVWQLENEQLPVILEGSGVGTKAVTFTPDGTHIVAGYNDGVLRKWDVESRADPVVLSGHTAAVTAVCVTADGKRIVSGSEDGTARVWDLATCQELRTVNLHSGPVSDVACVGSDRVISASWDCTIKVWALDTGAEHETLKGHTNLVSCIATTADGAQAVSGSGDDTLRIWNIGRGVDDSRSLIGHTRWVRDVALAEAGRTLVSASDDRTIRLWNLSLPGPNVRRTGHRSWVTAMALLPEGAGAVSASADSTLKVWDILTASELATLEGHTGRVTAVALDGVQSRVVSASDDGSLRVWTLDHMTRPECVAVVKGHAGPVNAVATGGGLIVSGSSDYTLATWDVETGMKQQVLTGHTAKIRAVACTIDGRFALSGSADGALILWNVAKGSRTILRSSGVGIKSVTILQERRLVVSGANDGSMALWNLDDGRLLRTWPGHTHRIDALDTTGDLIASASSDNTLVVWKVSSGADPDVLKLATFYGDSEIYACAVASNGAVIAAGDASGAVHFLALDGT